MSVCWTRRDGKTNRPVGIRSTRCSTLMPPAKWTVAPTAYRATPDSLGHANGPIHQMSWSIGSYSDLMPSSGGLANA